MTRKRDITVVFIVVAAKQVTEPIRGRPNSCVTTDVAALPDNAKCAHFYTPHQDGLKQTWEGVCWCNPPYGLVLRQWVKKACESAQEGATVVCLLPVRSDTHWWHDYVLPHAEVRYIRGRVKFNGIGNSAPFPSALVIFRAATC